MGPSRILSVFPKTTTLQLWVAVTVFVYLVVSVFTFDQLALEQGNSNGEWFSTSILIARLLGAAYVFGTILAVGYFLRSFASKKTAAFVAITVVAGLTLLHCTLIWLTFPGIISSDLNHMLFQATSLQIYDKYSFFATVTVLTGLSFTSGLSGLYLLGFVLSVTISLLVVGVSARARVSPVWAAFAVLAFNCMPTALFFLIYPGRDSLYSLLYAVVILAIAIRYFDRKSDWTAWRELALGILVGACMTMRSEGLLLFPLYCIVLAMSSTTLRSRTLLVLGCVVSGIFWTSGIERLGTEFRHYPSYSMTAVLNPLHEIIVLADPENERRLSGGPLAGDVSGNIQRIGRVLNIEEARKSYSFLDISLFFNRNGWRRNATEDDWQEFWGGSTSLLLDNTPVVAANRVRVFGTANGLARGMNFPRYRSLAAYQDQATITSLSGELDPDRVSLAIKIGNWIGTFRTLSSSPSWLIWSLGPSLILSFLILLFWHRAPLAAIFAALNLARGGIVFAFAPASFATYYSTLYNGIWIVLLVAACEIALHLRSRQLADIDFNAVRQSKTDNSSFISIVLFAAFSAAGWLLDLSLFATLDYMTELPVAGANFISSTVGAIVAFSGFAFLSNKMRRMPSISQVVGYTLFQFVSISLYSLIIGGLSKFFNDGGMSVTDWVSAAIAAKIFATPFNFATNYLASKTLLRFTSTKADEMSDEFKNNQSQPEAQTPRILLFIPAYNCATQISRVIARLDKKSSRWLREVLIVDNQSSDATIDQARLGAAHLDIEWNITRNLDNYGLGGSHKAAFSYAKAKDFDYLIVLHGDDQADIADIVPALETGEAFRHDCYLGSRFATGASLVGYSRLRALGNKVYNVLFSLVCRSRIEDLGSGLNMYRLTCVDLDEIHGLPDDLTFNYAMLMLSLHKKQDIRFFPISWREEDQSSNVRLVQQALRVLGLLAQRAWNPTEFFGREHRKITHHRYAGEVVHSSLHGSQVVAE